MSVKVQREAGLLCVRETSAPRQQVRRDRLRRSPAEPDIKPRPAESRRIESSSLFTTCDSVRTVSGTLSRLASSQLFSTRREVCGTCENRMPTLPEESCHMTSPDNRISEVLPGGENWK